MTTWTHLPNATHIDQVLADLKSHPREFSAAWNAARVAARVAAWDAAWGAAWGATWDAGRHAAGGAAVDTARSVARDAAGLTIRTDVWTAAGRAAQHAAQHAMMALVAWDHSAKYLTMTYQELNMWYQLNEDPACVLLLPYLKAKELISQKIEA